MAANLLSGFIGAIIGVMVTVGLYWHSRYTSARRPLVDRLMLLRRDVWWHCKDSSDVFNRWDKSVNELWVLYHALMDVAPFWKKPSLRAAWEAYQGAPQGVSRESREQAFDTTRPPETKDEFIKKLNALLKLLKTDEFAGESCWLVRAAGGWFRRLFGRHQDDRSNS